MSTQQVSLVSPNQIEKLIEIVRCFIPLATGAVVKHSDPQLLPNDQLLLELGRLGLVDSLQQLQLPAAATAFASRRRLLLAEFSRKKTADEVRLSMKFFFSPLLIFWRKYRRNVVEFQLNLKKIAKSSNKSE
jgi:hypothetical protein